MGTLFRAHAAYVGRCLRYLGVHEASLDDACQDVFLVAHRRRRDFRPGTSSRAWLYAITLRVARTYGRKARRRQEVMAEIPRPQEADESMARVDAREAALRLLSVLSEERRVVFVLYHVEQMSMREVSEVVGCPLQTAYSRLRAAQKQLTEAREEMA